MNTELLTWVLVGEVLVVGVVVLYLMRFVGPPQKKREHQAVTELAKIVKGKAGHRKEKLMGDSAFSLLEQEFLGSLIDDVELKEAKLYQHIVKTFLQKEVNHLKSLDSHVDELSEVYWAALKEIRQQATGDKGQDIPAELQAGLDIAIREKERLQGQLGDVLETLDKVSSEYADMFDETKDKEELLVSKERMMAYFQQAATDDAASFELETMEGI